MNPPRRAAFPLHTSKIEERIPVVAFAVVAEVHTVLLPAVYRLVLAGVGWLTVVTLVKVQPGQAGEVGAVVDVVGAA
jgi:hypothetical protein